MKTHSIQISSELLRLFSDVDEFKGAWRALGSLAPDRLRALRHVATIESVGSSTRIEGSKLSDREVEKLLLAIDVQQPDSRDEQEVAGYAQTIEMIFQAYADMPITENHIKQLHRDLLRHSQKDERHRGEYKKIANPVAAFNNSGQMVGVLLETASPFDTPRRMTELIHWFNEENELARLHPLIRIAVFIVAFLQIHPFQDGNGRVGRLIMFKECLANDIVPFIIGDDIKFFYYRGLQEWGKVNEYLMDTCLSAQDNYKNLLKYFQITF